MKRLNPKNPRLNVHLGCEWKACLVRYCRKRRISIASLIREAIGPFLDVMPEAAATPYFYTGEQTKEAKEAAAIDRILQNAPKKIE